MMKEKHLTTRFTAYIKAFQTDSFCGRLFLKMGTNHHKKFRSLRVLKLKHRFSVPSKQVAV